MTIIEAIKSGKPIRLKIGTSYTGWLVTDEQGYFYEDALFRKLYHFTKHQLISRDWEVKAWHETAKKRDCVHI